MWMVSVSAYPLVSMRAHDGSGGPPARQGKGILSESDEVVEKKRREEKRREITTDKDCDSVEDAVQRGVR